MENSFDSELNNLINELTQGKELATQLQMNLNYTSSSSDNVCEFLIERIKHSYEKVISMLNCNGNDLDQELIKDQKEPKKRKAMPTSSKKIQLCPGTRIEEQLDDGYSWRKYGQKVILGAKHPRCYYRCARGRDQGCLAKKKVQRSNNDPTVIDVTYIGGHTCNHVPNTPNPSPTPAPTLLSENGVFPGANNQPFQPFIDQSTSNINLENCIFLDNTMDDDTLDSMFISPEMWELNYVGGSHNAEASQSHEMKNPLISSSSAATTGANSQVVGFDFPVGSTDFDSKFDLGSR